MFYQWMDLSDSEIRMRLIYRGIPQETAIALVQHRDTSKAITLINRVLGHS